jgi:hypothetical protein
MATPKPIVELDFESAKQQLKDYLRSQTQFKDYNFEGSNMSVLLDVLSYNTYHNNFYTNMAINEMFLDSAMLRNSVVSHAKELNYLPRSRKSPKAVVRLRIDDPQGTIEDQTVTIPTYTEFTTSFLGQTFNFITNETYVARKTAPNVYETENIEIFEGEVLASFEREGFLVDDNGVLRVALSNPEVDTDSIVCFIDAEATEDQNVFTYRTDIFGVGPTDKVFYLEPYFDNRYNIYFGGNVFGLQPSEFEDVKVRYRITSGPEANGANKFTTSFLPNVQITVTTVSAAAGGAERESIESIKLNAPKSLQIQDRAITTNDYEILLKQEFPEISAVTAYGGDELEPPQFGKVAISVYLNDNAQLISQTLANSYIEFLKNRTPLTIEPFFVKTEFLYADLAINIYYTQKETEMSAMEIESLVRSAVKTHSTNNLNKFKSKLRLSRLMKELNDIDPSIESNAIIAKPIIEFSPTINQVYNPRFVFGTKLVRPYAFSSSEGFTNYKPAVVSSVFDQNGICVFFQDDGKGNIQIVTDDVANPQIVNPNAGSINYETGDLKLVNFETESYPGAAIKIYANSIEDDITSPNGRVFLVRDEDVRVNVYQDGQRISTAVETTDPITLTPPPNEGVIATTGGGSGSSGSAGGSVYSTNSQGGSSGSSGY